MKKFVSVLLILVMICSLAACSTKTPEASADNTPAYESALDVFNTMWNNVDEKFPVFGGKQEENGVLDAPALYDMSDSEGLNALLLIPDAVQANIDEVASMVHMMNANNFTGAVLHISNGDVTEIASQMEDAIVNNQFMCGFPEKLVMFSLDDYLFYAFGSTQAVDLLLNSAKNNLQGEINVICDKPME